VEEQRPVDFLSLYIPSNPFHSLADNIVPAVVSFSILLGIALIGFERKTGLLEHFRVLSDALMRITQWVAMLTPLGVFALSASLAGTLSIDELGRLQVYLAAYVSIALLMTFVVLPLFITSVTPLSYKQVVVQTKDVMIVAFATGSSLVVLPLLVERSKELLRLAKLNSQETESAVEIVLPAFLNFPKIGAILPISFVLFAGWFMGSPVEATQYPSFFLAGLVSSFGGVNMAMPFLLDLMRIPVDMLQLFFATSVITVRFGTLLSAMNNLLLAVVGACAVAGLLRVRWRTLARDLLIAIVLTLLTVGGIRVFFSVAVDNEYRKDDIVANMQLPRNPAPHTVYREPPPFPAVPQPAGQSRLALISERGTLRVGYVVDDLPFSYFNNKGELVGFDTEMAHLLASDLEVALVFVPVDLAHMAEQLNGGYCDIIMSGIAVTPTRALEVAFSIPYLQETFGFIVRDHRRHEFSSRSAVQRMQGLRIGVPNIAYYVDKLHDRLPRATLVPINHPKEFFEAKVPELDALAFPAEAASAWTLLYPEYTVAIPHPDVFALPLAYPLPADDLRFADFMNTWVELKQRDKSFDAAYDYWILGKSPAKTKRRWSVVRDVLNWVD
jgi:ABC-type amino acid transport substrate-binding protein